MDGRPLLGVLALSIASVAGAAEPIPVYGDWWYVMPEGWRDFATPRSGDPCDAMPWFQYSEETMYVPMNQPGAGHGGPTYEEGAWMSWYAMCLADQFVAQNAPISIVIRNRNCPFPYATGTHEVDPDALAEALDRLPRLDYVMMDLENWSDDGWSMARLNAEEIVRMVRSHPNPAVANAYLGNYGDWAGRRDESMIFRNKRDRNLYKIGPDQYWDRAQFYDDNFNASMPPAYPSESHSRHSEARLQRDHNTPNDEAAIFWAPLERVSGAARSLPAGHVLIPWVTPYSPVNGHEEFYHAPPPSAADLVALAKHYRMRGSLSYVIWTPGEDTTHHPSIDADEYRSLMIDAWRSLDPHFNSVDKVEFLNLDTTKTTGVEWSGVRAGDRVWVLVSNMHHELPQSATLPPIAGLPAQSPLIQPGEHRLFSYQVNPAVRDFDNNGFITREDYYAFIISLSNLEPWAMGGVNRSVGGLGTDSRDLNGDGVIDLTDIIPVSAAFDAGEYGQAYDTRGGSSGSDTNKPSTSRSNRLKKATPSRSSAGL
jgi:hypothetical protein